MRVERPVADALGDTPETVIPVSLLRRGLAEALVDGPVSHFDAAVVRSHVLPDEPWCYGRDADAVLRLLQRIDGWFERSMSPNVSRDLADPLAALIREEEDVEVRLYEDIYHSLTKPVPPHALPYVRLLSMRDVDLLLASNWQPQELGYATFGELFADGAAAGAIVHGKLRALAHTNALSERFGDIGAKTDKAYRGRGFATACASIVAEEIQGAGRIPVWSAGEDNWASLRVAEKLGFLELSRRVYLNVLRTKHALR